MPQPQRLQAFQLLTVDQLNPHAHGRVLETLRGSLDVEDELHLAAACAHGHEPLQIDLSCALHVDIYVYTHMIHVEF